MRHLYILCFWLCAIRTDAQTTTQPTHYAHDASLDKAMGNLIKREAQIDFERTPCLAIGIVVGDSTYFYGFGTTQKGKTAAPTDSTIFEIGSVTKAFTATLLAKAVADKKMNLEDSIAAYLPDYQLLKYKNKTIRLLDLATHTSGLPKTPFGIGIKEREANQPYKYYTAADIKESLHIYAPVSAPFDKYNYSHLGYDILAHTLQNVYNVKSYDALLTTQLSNSLHLINTKIELTAAQKTRLATGYSRAQVAMPPWVMSSFEGSLGLKSDTRDMIKYLRFQIDTPADWREAVAIATKAYHKSDARDITVGLGWHQVPVRRNYPKAIVHSGSTDGFRTYMAFIRETRTGVVIMTNSEVQINGLGPLILSIINYNFKHAPKNWVSQTLQK